MKILSLFNRPSLKPSWTYTPEGAIWRLFPAKTGELVGEARDQDTKRVSFFAVDGTTGTPFWQDRTFEEQWWISIEDVTEGILLLHKFASPDMPQHRGILAVDLKSGKQLWSNDEVTYWFAHKGSLFVHRLMFEKRLASELDAKSGTTVKEFGEEIEPSLFHIREEAIRTDRDQLQFPEIVDPALADSKIVTLLKKELVADGFKSPLEIAEIGSFAVLNYHTAGRAANTDRPALDSHLKILDHRTNGIIYNDTISCNSVGPVPDAFFIRNSTLYYIKDQKTLIAVHLSE